MALHHYVPRCILRGFCAPSLGPGKTYIFDKKSEKIAPRAIKSYFAIDDFYETPMLAPGENVERWFDREVENGVGEILARWRREKDPSPPSLDDQKALLSLLAAQMMRTPGRRLRDRNNITEMMKQLGQPKRQTMPKRESWHEELAVFNSFLNQSGLLGSFDCMDFALLRAPEGVDYVLGDDPVQSIQTQNIELPSNMMSSFHHSWPGAITMLPLSRYLCLALISPIEKRERTRCNFIGIRDESKHNIDIVNRAQFDSAVRYLAAGSKASLENLAH